MVNTAKVRLGGHLEKGDLPGEGRPPLSYSQLATLYITLRPAVPAGVGRGLEESCFFPERVSFSNLHKGPTIYAG